MRDPTPNQNIAGNFANQIAGRSQNDLKRLVTNRIDDSLVEAPPPIRVDRAQRNENARAVRQLVPRKLGAVRPMSDRRSHEVIMTGEVSGAVVTATGQLPVSATTISIATTIREPGLPVPVIISHAHRSVGIVIAGRHTTRPRETSGHAFLPVRTRPAAAG